MDDIGPVEYMVVAFPGNRFKGEIAPALAELVESRTIRIIDLAFVAKDDDGNVAAFEISDLDPDVQDALTSMGAEETGLFSEDDLMAAGEEIDPGSSAALLVWEDVWATRLTEAIRGADGVLLDLGRIPHEVVVAAREWVVANA
jgi:hypothetical protein